MITSLVVISLLILSLYISVMIFKNNGIPSSVSETFYSLYNKSWFGFSMISASALLMPAILEITPESYQFTAFLACVGMIMVGVSPNFKSEFERPIHVSGATMVLVFSQVWVALSNPLFLILWVPYIIGSIIGIEKNWNENFMESYNKTNPLFWIEIVSIISTYSCIIYLL